MYLRSEFPQKDEKFSLVDDTSSVTLISLKVKFVCTYISTMTKTLLSQFQILLEENILDDCPYFKRKKGEQKKTNSLFFFALN